MNKVKVIATVFCLLLGGSSLAATTHITGAHASGSVVSKFWPSK